MIPGLKWSVSDPFAQRIIREMHHPRQDKDISVDEMFQIAAIGNRLGRETAAANNN